MEFWNQRIDGQMFQFTSLRICISSCSSLGLFQANGSPWIPKTWVLQVQAKKESAFSQKPNP